jgi:hypothetical protein
MTGHNPPPMVTELAAGAATADTTQPDADQREPPPLAGTPPCEAQCGPPLPFLSLLSLSPDAETREELDMRVRLERGDALPFGV